MFLEHDTMYYFLSVCCSAHDPRKNLLLVRKRLSCRPVHCSTLPSVQHTATAAGRQLPPTPSMSRSVDSIDVSRRTSPVAMARLAAAVTLLSAPSAAKSAASGSPAPASSETVASVSAELMGCAAPCGQQTAHSTQAALIPLTGLPTDTQGARTASAGPIRLPWLRGGIPEEHPQEACRTG